MTLTVFRTRDADGHRLLVHLLTLDEHEARAGGYPHGDREKGRSIYLCAAVAPYGDLYPLDLVIALGVGEDDFLIDPISGHVLLADWPAGAPISPRTAR